MNAIYVMLAYLKGFYNLNLLYFGEYAMVRERTILQYENVLFYSIKCFNATICTGNDYKGKS